MYTIEDLRTHERELQFTKFTNEMALEIGLMLVEEGRERGGGITIDIARNGHQLFHYAFEGTTADNDVWVQRKIRVVNRFSKASYHVGEELRQMGKTIKEKFLLEESEYAPHGGSFPIIIKDVGVVGTITVSGLPQIEDHKLVTDVIKTYLNK